MTMRDPEETIRDWFRDGPARGSSHGLEDTLTRLALTKQPSHRELRLPLWLPAAAALSLLIGGVMAFGAGFRIVPPAPSPTPTPSASLIVGACRLEVPVHGKDAVVVGFGFQADADVTVEIDLASGSHLTLDATSGGPHTDRTGGFFLPLRPYPDALGRNTITAIAGCTASLAVDVTEADLPEPCPDPTVEATPLVDGPAYRAAVAADQPIAWWRMDDAGDTAADAAGNHTGTYVGQMEHAALSPLSDGGSAYFHHQFPGQAFVQLEPIVMEGDFSIETWLDFCHWPDGDTLVGSADSTAGLRVGEGELNLTNGVRTVLWAGEEVVSGAWQHIVVIRAGDLLEMYLNGELLSSDDSAGWTGAFPVSLLGASPDDNFLGYLDEVALYDHALSPERLAVHAHP